LAEELEILKTGLTTLGIVPKADIIAAFDLYRRELLKWNRVHNITAITDDTEIMTKHFLDSLLYLMVVPAGKLTLCDVGSGGGFPGMPIAMVRPDISVSLLEPSRKRVAFLRRIKRLLHLGNVEIIDCRAEDVVESGFDVVVTRATFSIPDMLNKAVHLLNDGGVLIMSKGPKYEEEIRSLPEGFCIDVTSVSPGNVHMKRHLIMIKRR
jgi:16S rRNA (guanine527-N7)-methyltransferase